MGVFCNVGEISNFEKSILKAAQKTLPKETKKMMRRAGNKLLRATRKIAEGEVKRKTGNYHGGFRRSKVYGISKGTSNETTAVKVYNSQPHAHLVEYGHKTVLNGYAIFVPGKHILDKAKAAVEPEFYDDIQRFIDEVASKI